MIEIVAAKDLKLGMFVTELDRPWLGTPFLVQGFLLDSEDDRAVLQRLCKFVSIDRLRSVGEEFKADAPLEVAPSFAGAGERRPVITMGGSGGAGRGAPGKQSLFAEILGTLRTNPHPSTEVRTTGGPVAQAQGGRVFDGLLARDDLDTGEAGDAASLSERWAVWRDRMTGLLARLRLPSAERPPAAVAPVIGKRELAGQAFPVSDYDTQVTQTTTVEQEILASYDVYRESQALISDLAVQLNANTTLDLDRIKDNVGELVESIIRNPDAMLWLAKLRHSNNYVYDHALAVSIHLMAFGRHLGLPKAELRSLGEAGLLQDIGIIQLPPELLGKAAPLTVAERKWIRKHVRLGYDTLRTQKELPKIVRDIILKHHERIDGSGYPRQLQGEQIGLFAEMAGLVDCYCAMVHTRAYRPALDSQKALEEINAMRGHGFSDAVTDEFIQSVGLYPVGTLVELNSGEVAVVIEQNRVRRLKPRLLVLLGPDKSRNPTPGMLNLLNDPLVRVGLPYAIVRALPQGSFGLDPKEFYL